MKAAPAGYDYFEVEADVGIHAWAPTLAEAFAEAALAALALAVDPAEVEPVDRREARAQGHSREALLVNWINECLYVHEIEGFVVRRVEVDHCDAGVIHGNLYGEEFETGRHRAGTIVKAATFHQVAIIEIEGGFDLRLVVDV